MEKTLSLILCLIFTTLGVIHFYWAFGGASGFDAALPTTNDGKRILNPSKVSSTVVGLGLAAFGAFSLLQSQLTDITLPGWISSFGGWLIPSIFLLRAIGDFNYVGFFKKVRQTRFGQLDTKYFSPLCITIAVIGIIIQLIR